MYLKYLIKNKTGIIENTHRKEKKITENIEVKMRNDPEKSETMTLWLVVQGRKPKIEDYGLGNRGFILK